jgi:hypothetical protein
LLARVDEIQIGIASEIDPNITGVEDEMGGVDGVLRASFNRWIPVVRNF